MFKNTLNCSSFIQSLQSDELTKTMLDIKKNVKACDVHSSVQHHGRSTNRKSALCVFAALNLIVVSVCLAGSRSEQRKHQLFKQSITK